MPANEFERYDSGMSKRCVLSLCVLALLVCGAAMPASADSSAAARQAAQMTGGRVLDVQTGHAGGKPVYFVRVLLADGRVKIVRIDAASGQNGRGR